MIGGDGTILSGEQAEAIAEQSDGTYKGMAAYTKYIEKRPSHIK